MLHSAPVKLGKQKLENPESFSGENPSNGRNAVEMMTFCSPAKDESDLYCGSQAAEF